MARDDKRARNKQELGKDKDIHLNVVGVPPKNVNVNKTKPSQNNEDYQLYRISIDTSGKEKERKHRLGSLEPSSKSKKSKNRKRFQSHDSSVLSTDSESDPARAQRRKTSGRRTPKQSAPRTKKKRDDDSEICFTIPGEKGKAIKIVGSSTKARDDVSATSSKSQEKSSGSAPRQVEFAALDEVYGTTPEESSGSSKSMPYKRTSPQVYKVENVSPNSLFRDPTKNSRKPETSAVGEEDKLAKIYPYKKTTQLPDGQDEQSKQGFFNGTPKSLTMGKSNDQRKMSSTEDKVPQVNRTGSRMLDFGRPSTSKSNDMSQPFLPLSKQKDDVRDSSYLNNSSRPHPTTVSKGFDTASSALPSTSHDGSVYRDSKIPAESKGKYPFYPYDKQKRSKQPTERPPEPSNNKQHDENLGKSEPYSHQKLPSIPEVRSTEQATGTTETNNNPKNISVLERALGKSHELDEPSSPTNRLKNDDYTPTTSKPLTHRKRPHWNKTEPYFDPLNETQNQSSFKKPTEINKSTPPSNLKTETSQPRKRSVSTENEVPEENVVDERLDKAKSNPPQKSLYSTPTSRQQEPLDKNPFEDKRLMANQTKKPAQINTSTSPLTFQESDKRPVLNYNVQNTPLQNQPTNNKNKFEQPGKYEGGLESKATPPLESSIYKLIKNDGPRESPKLIKYPTDSMKSNLVNKEVPVGNKSPVSKTRPETASKEISTEIPEEAKEQIMLEIQSELSRKSSPQPELSRKPSPPSKKSIEDHSERKKLGVGKESKSKLKTFVSSIPKPLFRRHKSPTSDEKKTTNKSVQQLSTQPKVNPPTAATTNDGTRIPVVESSIVKKDHEKILQPYPAWVTSPDSGTQRSQLKSHSLSSGPPKNEATKFTASQRSQPQSTMSQTEPVRNINISPDAITPSQRSRAQSTMSQTEPVRNINISPDAITNESASVEIANTSYGEDPLAKRAGAGPRISEDISRSTFAVEDGAPNKFVDDKKLKDIDSASWTSLPDEKSNHSDQSVKDERGSGYKNRPHDMNVVGANILAYPGRINEQTPFGYESQFSRGPNEEDDALESLKEAYERKGRRSKDESLVDSKSGPKTGDAMSPGNEKLKQSPVGLQNSPHSLKAVGYDPIQDIKFKGATALKQDKPPYDGFPESKKDGRSISSSKTELKDKSPLGTGFGKFPVQTAVYLGQVPDKTYNVFNAAETQGGPQTTQRKNVSPRTEAPGPKGILIFVSKKDETPAPFESNAPSRKKGNNSAKDEKSEGPKQNNLKKKTSSSSGDTQLTSRNIYAGGDKKVTIEKSPSGRKTTQKYPCGCFRIIMNDPESQTKREDLISAYCRKGSQCDVRNPDPKKKIQTYDPPSDDEISRRKKPTPNQMFPEIEVVAEGVMSKKPLKPRTPAPTMNGANLTGTFNVKSNQFNGVCNFYLDKKLKKYLLNNMDKFKQLLEDNPKR